MDLMKIVNEIVEKNPWLSGMVDFLDGDVMAIANIPDKFRVVVEFNNLKTLYLNLKNYDGVYKYRNLLFFSDWQYGIFVYDINDEDRGHYAEHLSKSISFEHFKEVLEDLLT